MPEIKRQVAGYLLQSKAIILEPTKPFTWASGWRSPIYCDNRVTLSYPEIRDFIKESFVGVIRERYPSSEVIAGVATGAIAQGALVADAMNLPFIYVRSSAKEHGRQNMVEGRINPGQKVVVIEDLVSTGGSSLKAVEALRGAGAEVTGMVAIFSYGFQKAHDNFRKADVVLTTLTDYHTLVEKALETGDIRQDQVEMLQEWRKNPDSWGTVHP
jgi:orotate phosphoribosyltransferase